MRKTVAIDDDVYEAALANARATGGQLGRVLSDMARAALRPQKTPPTRGKRARFATFEVAEASPMISASGLQGALDDGGVV
ncbi:MAG TPA: antitoxin [Thermoanaerobaculia bacterium]|nr:antitoxin [Thermoanaerobaculia bacterium]